jgi:hypothetical protein
MRGLMEPSVKWVLVLALALALESVWVWVLASVWVSGSALE